jgi:hypothetical protein
MPGIVPQRTRRRKAFNIVLAYGIDWHTAALGSIINRKSHANLS